MNSLKKLFLTIVILGAFQKNHPTDLAERFKEFGYVELLNNNHGTQSFNALYQYFDELIIFFEKNPKWAHRLYSAKERFIRSKERDYYSTNFFGFYDESEIKAQRQISFYYSIHFHEFICSKHPELTTIPQIINFLNACFEIQKPYKEIFEETATHLGLENIFSSEYNKPPVLLKVAKYLPSYVPTRPHYDGTALTLLIDSTDNQSLLFSPYKSELSVNDFYSPERIFARTETQNSILLIPGSQLTEFSIYPTPHIVMETGKTRYAAVAFAMRPHYVYQRNELSPLPRFKD